MQNYDAILIDSNTALIDNPLLTCRNINSIYKQPTRIILDNKDTLSLTLNIFDSTLPGKTILVTTSLCYPDHLKELKELNIHTIITKTSQKNQISIFLIYSIS